jgi:hypothetical protein
MSEGMRELPVIQRGEKEQRPSCSGCEKGCCGALGIRSGAEKEEVYRNLFIYLTMGAAVIIGTLVLRALFSYIAG